MTDITDGQKKWQITQLMGREDAWDQEDRALEIAYSIGDSKVRQQALRRIADRMTALR